MRRSPAQALKTALTALATALLLLDARHATAQETAYAAMRTVGQSRQDALARILEIRGTQGATQPLVWKITVADPAARGGLREFEVSGGAILSERAPTRSTSDNTPDIPIDPAQLNMDSDAAFLAAHKAAKDMQVGFDSANYTLRSGNPRGLPVWTVELVDWDGTLDAVVAVAASDGRILRAEKFNGSSRPSDQGSQFGGFLGRTSEALGKAGDSTKRTFYKGAASVEEWLTGNRTLDEDLD